MTKNDTGEQFIGKRLPLDDRLWRHPSERMKYPPFSDREHVVTRQIRTRVSLLLSTVVAMVMAVVTAAFIGDALRDPRTPAKEEVSHSPNSSPQTSAIFQIANDSNH